jgi:1-acyl-sn-glycerol-3-phosphate acyltransferase
MSDKNLEITNPVITNSINSKQMIPYPQFKSYMHQRIALPQESKEQRLLRYKNQEPPLPLFEGIVAKLLNFLNILKPGRRWAFHRIAMRILNIFFGILNRREVHGRENIPKQGAIFISNHNNMEVVVPFIAMFRKPIGVFTDMGDTLFTDIAELFGFVTRVGVAPVMIEKMIRQMFRNRYFVMWPEGTPDKGHGVMTGFSGIVRVYATINYNKDRVPFVPVVTRDIDPIWKGKPHGPKKVIYDILKPVFVPRKWLLPPEEGGKSQREIIDALMSIIAHKRGQKELWPNPSVNHRRKHPQREWH